MDSLFHTIEYFVCNPLTPTELDVLWGKYCQADQCVALPDLFLLLQDTVDTLATKVISEVRAQLSSLKHHENNIFTVVDR